MVITHAKLNNYDGSFLECYVGHSPRSISEKHYFPRLTSIQTHSRGQEQALMRIKEVFTEHVVRHLEEGVAINSGKSQQGGTIKEKNALICSSH